jgi:hypothetical protein
MSRNDSSGNESEQDSLRGSSIDSLRFREAVAQHIGERNLSSRRGYLPEMLVEARMGERETAHSEQGRSAEGTQLDPSANSLSLDNEEVEEKLSDRIKRGENLFDVDSSHSWDVIQKVRQEFALKPDDRE